MHCMKIASTLICCDMNYLFDSRKVVNLNTGAIAAKPITTAQCIFPSTERKLLNCILHSSFAIESKVYAHLHDLIYALCHSQGGNCAPMQCIYVLKEEAYWIVLWFWSRIWLWRQAYGDNFFGTAPSPRSSLRVPMSSRKIMSFAVCRLVKVNTNFCHVDDYILLELFASGNTVSRYHAEAITALASRRYRSLPRLWSE